MNLPIHPDADRPLPVPTDAPLVMLHPGLRGAHPYLAEVLRHSPIESVFVLLQHDQTSAAELAGLLARALNEQCGCGLANDATLQASLSGLAAHKPYQLVFGDFDRAAEPDGVLWLEHLLAALPNGCRIVLSGRRLPEALNGQAGLRRQTAFFPIDPYHMLHDYSQCADEPILLEVFGLGAGKALVNGRLIAQWDGLLPHMLFFYLVDHGLATRDDIFQTFWPGLSIREATNVFHVTKRKISELLGFDLTMYWSGFYRIAPNIDLRYDVHKFVENVQNSAVADDADAIALLERACRLYRSAFLTRFEGAWARARRAELSANYTDALLTLAQLYERRGDSVTARGLQTRAANSQPRRPVPNTERR